MHRTTVHDYTVAYKNKLSQKRKAGKVNLTVDALPSRKQGRKLLLGEEIDEKVQKYLRAYRSTGGGLSTDVVVAAAKAIVTKMN